MIRRFFYLFRMASLICIDLAAYYFTLVLAALSVTNLLHFGSCIKMPEQQLFIFLFIPMVLVFINQLQKLYQTRYPFWEETKELFKTVVATFFFVFVTVTIRNIYPDPVKLILAIFGAYLCFLLPISRFWGKKLLFRLGIWKDSVLIIGAGESGVATLKGLLHDIHLGYHVVAFLDDDPKKIGKTVEVGGRKYKVFGPISSFEKFVHILGIETVFIANPISNQAVLANLVREIYKVVKRIIIIPDIKGVAIFNSEMHYLVSEKMFFIKMHNNLNSLYNIVIKRVFDFTCSIIALIVFSPLYITIALLVKLTSRGRVIFAHTRVGKNGREFKAYKFRTMYDNAGERLAVMLKSDPKVRKEWEKNYKLKDDPRVTPVGRFLRKTSLDEIPQIFNIIRGEMSLVGPRPVIMDEIEKYYGSFREYYFSVTPGLAGLWQVSGRSDTDYTTRIQMDVWYVQNWSLWLDITLIFRTVEVVLRRKGAY